MTIAGVHSVAVIDSTFLRDSPSQSPGRRGDGERGSSQPSSILQIWREIEDERAGSQVQGGSGETLLQERSDELVPDQSQENMPDIRQREGHMIGDADLGENESEIYSQLQSQGESHDEQEELNNPSSENSHDLGEVERERVRQIFREWKISGDRDHASNIYRGNSGSRGEWLEEVEQERVSVTRDLVQTSGQQSAVSSGDNKEERSSVIGTQVESVRDGFVVNQNEGQPEHTRRGIRKLCGRQVLLDMLKKAEMERQREVQELLDHRAVSHFPHRNRIQALLRGRFLRNDRSVDNNRSFSIAESELGLLRKKQTVSGLREGFFSRKDNSGSSQVMCNLSDTSSVSDIDVNTIENTGASSLHMVRTIHSEQSDADNRGSDDRTGISGGQNCSLGIACENLDWQDSNANVEPRDWESSSSIGVTRGDSSEQNIDMMPTEGTANDPAQQSLQMEDTGHSNMQELTGVHAEQPDVIDIMDDESNLSNHNIHVEGNIVEWRNSTEESVDGNQLSSTSNEWPQNILGDGVNSRLPEAPEPEMWQEDGDFQEAVEIWLGAPSDHEIAQDGRIHGFYFPDDNNVYSVELRELLSRRSVSNLLHSSFRESLDQLIQSYVERQGHAHVQWELQDTISPPSTEQDPEQQSRNRITGPADAVNSPLDLPLPPPPPPPPRPQWDRHSRHDNWSQIDINNQRLGIEWDIIGDMRMDMVRLQQRMNNMQRMMETCMDMQLELQRSIKQEVSAALNRSSSSSGIHDHDSQNGQSNWECVRKGVCCMCCESKIDSLLYRCGHMCTCSKCANDLLKSRRKCPMCYAPVVEVIRAYSI
ncbi:hypothetical protein Lal_00009800 [Lupinus albus]|uniref:Putative transcription factor C2H2 family n=1 Tax=Lupinus albus TaxID=3870 RepID=A0A6A4NGI1_LUPAL|nr:putative transcription factor C2H2 family [Lupinus albus]KAF1859216.1 hypothetical protein Lal_00009800 [Lupinus albus]